MNLLVNRVLVDLGFIQIYWYSLFIFIALFIGGALALREGKKYGISEDKLINMFFFLIPISIIGARIYYVAFECSKFSSDPLQIFAIWGGGLAIHGGMIAGLIFVILYCYKHEIKIGRMTDILVVSLILGQAIGRWGNFFNGEVYGIQASYDFLKAIHLPDFIINGLYSDGIYHHPLFLYESLWCLLGFIILVIFRNLKYTKVGQVTGLYFIWYGIGRFFLEGMRDPEFNLKLGNIRISMVISILMVVAGLIIVFVKGKGNKFDDTYKIKN